MNYSFTDKQSGKLVDLNEIDELCCKVGGSVYSGERYSDLYQSVTYAMLANALRTNGEMSALDTIAAAEGIDMSHAERNAMFVAIWKIYDKYTVKVWR